MYIFIIGEGAEEFTFSSPRTKWTPGIDNTWNLLGFKDQEVETQLFEGLLRGADAEPTFDAWDEIRQVAKRNTAQRLRVFIDATLKLDLNPVDMIAGPFIDFFRADSTPGAFSNHVKFRLMVRAITAGGGQFSDNPQVSSVQRAIEVEDFNDRFQRKEWRATAGGDDALTLAESFRPDDVEPLRQIISRNLDANTVTVRYVHEAKSELSIVETIVITPGGRPIREVNIQPGEDGVALDPLLFRGRKRATKLVVIYRKSGINKSDMTIPDFHFDEDSLDETQSERDFEPRFDDKTGIFEINSREVYLFRDIDDIGEPDHSDHTDVEEPDEEPSDGDIAA